MSLLSPRYGYCKDCGEGVHNIGAHAEACPGPAGRRRVFSGEYQCKRDLSMSTQGGQCFCGEWRFPVFLPVDSPGGRRILSGEGRLDP